MKTEHKILHQKFVRFGANSKEWMRKCALLLPEIEKERIWEQKGFGSIYEYAAKLAGMSRPNVDDALRILRKTQDMPAIRKVIEEKGLGAIRPIVAIVTEENAEFWAEKAQAMSKHTLEVYVKEMRENKNLFRPGTENKTKNPQQKAIFSFDEDKNMSCDKITEQNEHISQDIAAYDNENPTSNARTTRIFPLELSDETIQTLQKLKGDRSWEELMREFLQLREEKLEATKPQSIATESRYIPAHIMRYLLGRSGGLCEFPKCMRTYEILHHTQRFALEKIHDTDRIRLLCKPHERIAHLGLIENEENTPPTWKVQKEPDRNAPKYNIDQLVAKYR